MGAAIGAELGKAFDGQRLLALFGLLMIGVGISMLRKRRTALAPNVRLTRESAGALLPRLIPIGLATGLAAGFFGIGGGFLIVPGLMLAAAMPLRYAVGSSLTVSGIVIGKKLGACGGLLERGFAMLVIAIGAYVAVGAI